MRQQFQSSPFSVKLSLREIRFVYATGKNMMILFVYDLTVYKSSFVDLKHDCNHQRDR